MNAAVKELHWVRVAQRSLIPLNEGRRVVWGERQIALFNLGETFLAVDNRCPHKQGPLSDGIVAGGAVYCPLHNWKIDLRSGCALAGGEGRVRSYPVRVVGDEVEIGFEISERRLPMKEIMAILRPNRWAETKRALTNAGILAFTQLRVYGHGKQNGLQSLRTSRDTDKQEARVTFLPKRLVLVIVPEPQVELAVNAIIQANQTGAIGDGKIFVSPVEDVIQVRTGETEGKLRQYEEASS